MVSGFVAGGSALGRVSAKNGRVCSRRGGLASTRMVAGWPDPEKLIALMEEDETSGPKWEDSPEYQEFLKNNEGRTMMRTETVKCRDAIDFFKVREGNWKSWRVSHHLAFRRDEVGTSDVKVEFLDAKDERIISLCKDNEVDPSISQGGCYVTWKATMAWDAEGENHEGSTIFALVSDSEDGRSGRLLRDRGYAEMVPIAGTYKMDEKDSLHLITPYDGGEVKEEFWFDGADIINRVSTVNRFGGMTNATFATEMRDGVSHPSEASVAAFGGWMGSAIGFSELPPPPAAPVGGLYRNRLASPYARNRNVGPPSANSAFGPPSARSAFGASPASDTSNLPPSLRGDFLEDETSDASGEEAK